jgi:drug/metabolite transporter (DMT)-like permease
VIAVLGGLGAAFAWALSTLCSSRSSRMIQPTSVVAWVMLVGLVISAPPALASGVPDALGSSSGAWLAASSAGNVAGLLLAYRALRTGQIALVAPLVSTEGAIAAVIALLAGEHVAPGVAAMLFVIVVGVCLASVSETSSEEVASSTPRMHAILAAVGAAMAFGGGLYATARAGAHLPTSWVVLAARVLGVAAVAAPLAAARRLELRRPAVPLVLVSGVCEVLGFYSYTTGARHGIAIAAVLASQFAALAALTAYLVFGERLTRTGTVGVFTVMIGVAVLSALRA